jgi:uncharacterized membrane-anchored protein
MMSAARNRIASALGVLCFALGATAQETLQEEQRGFPWLPGPTALKLHDIAEVAVPEGYLGLEAAPCRQLLEAMGNLTSGNEVGCIAPASDDESWFIFFDYSADGYVKDDDKDELNAADMMEGILENNKHANEVRGERGMPSMQILGWVTKPYYDESTNNLEWAINLAVEGSQSVNHNTRLLGREGVVEVSVVGDPEDLQRALPLAKGILSGFSFNPGLTYAEYKEGDKIADYTLTGLVAGGVVAVGLWTGLFKKLGKFLILIVVGIGVFFKKLFGRSKSKQEVGDPVS